MNLFLRVSFEYIKSMLVKFVHLRKIINFQLKLLSHVLNENFQILPLSIESHSTSQ